MTDEVRHEELKPDVTEGFKVGQKKTLDEYRELDKDDEAMVKWKQSLLTAGGADISDPNDPRTCIIQSLALEVEGRPDITIQVHNKEDIENLKNKPFIIKEGSQYRMKVTFKVQHGILSGLKYVQVVKRGPLKQKDQEMIGSFSPNTDSKPFYEKKFQAEEAPSGMLVRGKYSAASSFVDDDNVTHLAFNWAFEIKKDW